MRITRLFLLLCTTLVATTSFAGVSVNTEDKPVGIVQVEDLVKDRTLAKTDKQLIKAEKQQYRAEKRVAWIVKLINKKIARSQNKSSTDGKTSMSLLSMIGGILGFLLLFIPYVSALGLLLAIAGFVLGLVSMKKEGSNVYNILGVVFGGFVILLFLVAAIIVASWGFW